MISKTNQFIKDSISLYDKFELFKLMKLSSILMDDISNWYVRRNRRRFWKSENDEDKMIAYSTLYYVLTTYIKVLCPVIPFITEKIYENLVCNIDSSQPKSIHLSDFPLFDEKLVFADTVKEIDIVKEIVSLGRSARNKVNIKIRQPLQKVEICIPEIDMDFLKKYEQQILEELNVKEIKYVKNVKNILKYKLKPNFNILGQKFGKEIGAVLKKLNLESIDEIHKVFSSNEDFIFDNGNYAINKDELIVDEIPKDHCSLSTSLDIKISIDTNISSSLKEEGLVRDLIRFIQNHRKDCSFEVEDRIIVQIKCNELFYNAVSNNMEYFKNETLCKELNRVDLIDSNENYLKINSQNVELAIKRL